MVMNRSALFALAFVLGVVAGAAFAASVATRGNAAIVGFAIFATALGAGIFTWDAIRDRERAR